MVFTSVASWGDRRDCNHRDIFGARARVFHGRFFRSDLLGGRPFPAPGSLPLRNGGALSALFCRGSRPTTNKAPPLQIIKITLLLCLCLDNQICNMNVLWRQLVLQFSANLKYTTGLSIQNQQKSSLTSEQTPSICLLQIGKVRKYHPSSPKNMNLLQLELQV